MSSLSQEGLLAFLQKLSITWGVGPCVIGTGESTTGDIATSFHKASPLLKLVLSFLILRSTIARYWSGAVMKVNSHLEKLLI